MIKVAIADDHPLMLEGVKRVLNREMDIEVISEANKGGEVLDILAEEIPDILILDLSMPGKSGLDLLKDIRVMYPDLPVLILSIHPEDRFAVRCIKAGANGYLSKSSISDELSKAVHKIAVEKRKYITPDVAEQLASQMDDKGRPPHELLSDREFEVLCMIADGSDVQKIAKKLNLSPHTVHTYRSRIKEKLHLSTNVEMTRYAIENDLIS
ncbi:response regulator [Rhodohalobacter sp. 614A]|uniref:response regulator n=1 Tax=Rhodohalobacter sp. 614A TaxID=2908649 RepID=UPI001F385325|nr:response regulator transcription factor [Rhodohalobacter sp. 614A]